MVNDKFIKKIEKIIEKYDKSAMFIDMDGTVVEYVIYTENDFKNNIGMIENAEPLLIVIDKLRKLAQNNKLDLYILSMAKNTRIVQEKKAWLKKYMNFIKESNWIILDKELNDFNSENRNEVKAIKMQKKLAEYDHIIFLDDDHKVLRKSQEILKDKLDAFHVSSALI